MKIIQRLWHIIECIKENKVVMLLVTWTEWRDFRKTFIITVCVNNAEIHHIILYRSAGEIRVT